MEPSDHNTVVYNPQDKCEGRSYRASGAVPPRPPYPKPPDPPPAPDPPARPLEKDLAVIVTRLNPDQRDGVPLWQIARMARETFRRLNDGHEVDRNDVVFEGQPMAIRATGSCSERWKAEVDEANRIAKLLCLPVLLRYHVKETLTMTAKLAPPKYHGDIDEHIEVML